MILYINEIPVVVTSRLLLTKAASKWSDIPSRHSTLSNLFKVRIDSSLYEALGYSANTHHDYLFTTQRQPAYLQSNEGKNISRGFVSLISHDSVRQEVQLRFYSGNAEWFFLLQDKLIGDLDLSDLDHDWGVANIIGSFDNEDGYIYPIVDYGDKTFNGSLIDEVEGWLPAVFQKEYVERIFRRIGYDIEGPFLDEPVYKKAIIPFTNERVKRSTTQEPIAVTGYMSIDRLFEPSGVAALGVGTSEVGLQPDFVETNDPSQFDVSRDKWTNTNTFGTSYFFRAICKGRIRYVTSGGFDQPGTNTFVTKLVVYRVASGAPVASANLHAPHIYNGNTDVEYEGDFLNTVITVPQSLPGEELEVRIVIEVQNVEIGPVVNYTVDLTELRIEANDAFVEDLAPGQKLFMASNVPRIQQRDLIKDMIIRHGLIVQTDHQAKRVTFTPFRNVVRSIPDAVDWSGKVNMGEVLKVDFIEPVRNYGQVNRFSYTEDSEDYFVNEYNSTQKVPFGNGHFSLPNEFIGYEKDLYESVFAATRNIKSYNEYINVPYIPRFSYDGSRREAEPRILILAGNVTLADVAGGDALASVRIGGAVNGTTTFTAPWSYFYKQRDFLENDSPFHDIDLNLAYDAPQVPFNTDRGLLPEWYREIINTLKKPALVEVSVRLYEYEFETLDFTIPVMLETPEISGYFAIDEVQEYEGPDTSTIVRLIQIR